MTDAYNLAGSATGYANPYITGGADMQNSGADMLNQGYDYIRDQANPMFNTGADMIQDSYGGLNNASDYLNQANNVYNSATNLANASAVYDPNQTQVHLNPYLEGVLSEISRLGNENLFEDIIPNVNSTFVGSGQFGSDRNGDFLNNAIRNTQREILGKQGTTLKEAWDSAAGDYLNWSKLGLDSAGALSNIGQGYNSLAGTSIDQARAGGQMGEAVANVGGQMSNSGSAMINAGSTLGDMGTNYGQYGINASDNNWQDLANLFDFGNQNMAYDQKVLDNSYNTWQDSWDKPLDVMDKLSGVLQRYGSLTQPDMTRYDVSEPQQDNSSADWLAWLQMIEGMDL
jgi:hypothetical protein